MILELRAKYTTTEKFGRNEVWKLGIFSWDIDHSALLSNFTIIILPCRNSIYYFIGCNDLLSNHFYTISLIKKHKIYFYNQIFKLKNLQSLRTSIGFLVNWWNTWIKWFLVLLLHFADPTNSQKRGHVVERNSYYNSCTMKLGHFVTEKFCLHEFETYLA